VTQDYWAMMCLDGCAATFFTDEISAVTAFQGHYKIHHRAILCSPGTYKMPSGFMVGVTQDEGEGK